MYKLISITIFIVLLNAVTIIVINSKIKMLNWNNIILVSLYMIKLLFLFKSICIKVDMYSKLLVYLS